MSDLTFPGAEGMQERRIRVHMVRDTDGAVVTNDTIWRVHVEGPAFRTSDSLGVGTTVATLRVHPGARAIEGEGAVFVTVDDHCGLSFRLGGVASTGQAKIAALPDTARVTEVLAFGCHLAR